MEKESVWSLVGLDLGVLFFGLGFFCFCMGNTALRGYKLMRVAFALDHRAFLAFHGMENECNVKDVYLSRIKMF